MQFRYSWVEFIVGTPQANSQPNTTTISPHCLQKQRSVDSQIHSALTFSARQSASGRLIFVGQSNISTI